ncbi:WecB/TagA/CpsF family glycosyltransferase [Paenibacillus senegalensis]|uniref:WecB/TagA/CpsF family glycosyltransferase n=1 Tax=Paenibacillus senegalensis TaxID=1465766 RepID=UPI000287A58D
MKFQTVTIFGVPFSKMSLNETVEYLTNAIQEKRPHQVITANPIMVMEARKNNEYLDMMKRAELIVPDGAGIVWAANYVGEPVAERVTGFELLHELLKVGEKHRWKVYLLGASPDIIQAAADKLKQQYPLINFAGIRDGYFGPEQDEEIIADIQGKEPDLLLVGRSADRQEPWIDKYKHRLQVPVMMGVGGSYDVISGKLKRAPQWFIRMRLEWFYRLLQEPWRYKRMMVLPKFALSVIRHKDKVTRS